MYCHGEEMYVSLTLFGIAQSHKNHSRPAGDAFPGAVIGQAEA